MDPIQASPIANRPDLDAEDAAVGWVPGPDRAPPAVVVNAPEPPAWWQSARGPTPWGTPRVAPTAPAAPPAWPAPAVAELGRLIASLGGSPTKPAAYPPLRTGVRTYSPFGG